MGKFSVIVSSRANRNSPRPSIMLAPMIFCTLATFCTGTMSFRKILLELPRHKQLSNDVKEKILYKNAKELYSL